MFDIAKASLNKNPFIGLYFKCNDGRLFYPRGVEDKTIEKFKSVLKVEAFEFSVNNSPLVGLYVAVNSNGCVVPKFATDAEIKGSMKSLNVAKIGNEFSAVSNNILANDNGCIVNPRMQAEDVKKISDCLGVEVVKKKIGGFNLNGAFNTATNKGVLACNNATDEELKEVESILKVKAVRGTTNMGLLANSIGLVANSKGCLVGEATSGFEINRIFEAIGD